MVSPFLCQGQCSLTVLPSQSGLCALFCMVRLLLLGPDLFQEMKEERRKFPVSEPLGQLFHSLIVVLLSNNSAGQPVSRYTSLCLSHEAKKKIQVTSEAAGISPTHIKYECTFWTIDTFATSIHCLLS